MLMVCGRRKKVGRKENVNGIRAREEKNREKVKYK